MEDVRIFYGHLSILRPFDICRGNLVYFVAIWCILPRFGILDQEKSGNRGWRLHEFYKKLAFGDSRSQHVVTERREQRFLVAIFIPGDKEHFVGARSLLQTS
jgi:hypothetical protein